jgi:hypothetical protein
VNDCGGVHQIVGWCLVLLLLVMNREFPRYIGDLLFNGGEGKVLRVEIAHVGFKHRGRIPPEIQGDKNDWQPFAFAS